MTTKFIIEINNCKETNINDLIKMIRNSVADEFLLAGDFVAVSVKPFDEYKSNRVRDLESTIEWAFSELENQVEDAKACHADYEENRLTVNSIEAEGFLRGSLSALNSVEQCFGSLVKK